jgi:hypothetical protein
MFGNAEIQELHAAVRFHQDIRGLKIAMNDGVPVGILHRLAHQAEEPQPLLERRPSPLTVLGKGKAFDILHGEPRRAIRQDSGVQKASYGGMIELGQGTLFDREAFAASGR